MRLIFAPTLELLKRPAGGHQDGCSVALATDRMIHSPSCREFSITSASKVVQFLDQMVGAPI
jgi:hypothetical protein